MHTSLMDRIATSASLMAAWRQVRANRGAAGIDQVTIQKFEAGLEGNLANLALALREDRYYSMPIRQVQIPKQDGGTRDLGIFTVEDRIAQRAVLDAVEPLFEPDFLDCSFGYRTGRSVQDAVARVEELKRMSNHWAVDADIQNFFGNLNHDLLMRFAEEKIGDRAVLRLIRMWLDAGQVGQDALPDPLRRVVRLIEQGDDRLRMAIRSAADRLAKRAGWEDEDFEDGPYAASCNSAGALLKQLGKDALVFVATNPRLIRKFSRAKSLALGGAALVAVSALPALARAIAGRRRVGVVQGGPISPLLANVYLHRFDREMTDSGYHLVRYADDFVILCSSQGRAQHAMKVARGALQDLKLELSDRKTQVVCFEEGFQFLGYSFDRDGSYPISEGWTFPLNR